MRTREAWVLKETNNLKLPLHYFHIQKSFLKYDSKMRTYVYVKNQKRMENEKKKILVSLP